MPIKWTQNTIQHGQMIRSFLKFYDLKKGLFIEF